MGFKMEDNLLSLIKWMRKVLLETSGFPSVVRDHEVFQFHGKLDIGTLLSCERVCSSRVIAAVGFPKHRGSLSRVVSTQADRLRRVTWSDLARPAFKQ